MFYVQMLLVWITAGWWSVITQSINEAALHFTKPLWALNPNSQKHSSLDVRPCALQPPVWVHLEQYPQAAGQAARLLFQQVGFGLALESCKNTKAGKTLLPTKASEHFGDSFNTKQIRVLSQPKMLINLKPYFLGNVIVNILSGKRVHDY